MCIFCKIVAKDIPAKIITENEEFLAFQDINPKAPIHILVMPKAHFESFEDFPSEKMVNLSNFIKEVTKVVGLKKDGYRLITNIGENGCQEVYHVHFHILSGKKLDMFADFNHRYNNDTHDENRDIINSIL